MLDSQPYLILLYRLLPERNQFFSGLAVKYSIIIKFFIFYDQIFLAVDIKNGKVVKAYAGTRLNYKPLKIKNKDFSDANLVIKKAISVGIKNIYIADLDSIENRKIIID